MPSPPLYSPSRLPQEPLFKQGDFVKIRGGTNQGSFVVIGIKTADAFISEASTCYQLCRPLDRCFTSKFGSEIEAAADANDEDGLFIRQILAIALKSSANVPKEQKASGMMEGEKTDRNGAWSAYCVFCSCCNGFF